MCVYNGEEYLKEAIQSILGQTFTDFEFLIVNDASEDRSAGILSAIADPRIRIIDNETNIGLTKSLNKALRLAKGEFIARMDADDRCHRERFNEQVKFLEDNPDIALCGTWVSYDENSHNEPGYPLMHEEIKAGTLSNNPFAHPSVMWRREEFERQGLTYNEDFRTSQDFELWSRAVHKVKTANIPRSLLFYRQHKGQISRARAENQQDNARKIKLSQLKYLGLSPDEKETTAHLCMVDGGFRTHQSAEIVKDADEWMYKIILANRQLGIYEERFLLELWKSRFFGTSMYSYDPAKWRVLRNSWCVKLCKVSRREKLKARIKCFLGWKVKE